jgi:hypothetical protein
MNLVEVITDGCGVGGWVSSSQRAPRKPGRFLSSPPTRRSSPSSEETHACALPRFTVRPPLERRSYAPSQVLTPATRTLCHGFSGGLVRFCAVASKAMRALKEVVLHRSCDDALCVVSPGALRTTACLLTNSSSRKESPGGVAFGYNCRLKSTRPLRKSSCHLGSAVANDPSVADLPPSAAMDACFERHANSYCNHAASSNRSTAWHRLTVPTMSACMITLRVDGPMRTQGSLRVLRRQTSALIACCGNHNNQA